MLEAELAVAIDAAQAAGEILLGHFHRGVTPETKPDGEPVSVADKEADALITSFLMRAFPNDALLSEEGVPSASRLHAKRVWIVDPLDGTKDFLTGSSEFAVHVGLAIDGLPVLGVVHRPAPRKTFVGVPGVLAAFSDAGGPLSPIQAASLKDRLRIAVTRRPLQKSLKEVLADLPGVELIRCGSSGLKCALVAQGESDAYLAVTSSMGEWDACAPHALVLAAGGTCTDLLGQSLTYNRPEPFLESGFVAASEARSKDILSAIAPRVLRLGYGRAKSP